MQIKIGFSGNKICGKFLLREQIQKIKPTVPLVELFKVASLAVVLTNDCLKVPFIEILNLELIFCKVRETKVESKRNKLRKQKKQVEETKETS